MKDQLLLTTYMEYDAAFLLEEGQLVQISLEKSDQDKIGDIYIGKVKSIAQNINAAFIEYKKGCMGFLPLTDLRLSAILNRMDAKELKCEDEVLVQIAKEPIKTKDATLTCDIGFAGTYFVLIPKSHGIHYSKKITEQQKQDLWQVLDRIMPMLFGNLAVFLDRYGLIVRTNAALAEETTLFQELHDLFHKASKVLQTADKRTVYSCIYREADLFEQAIRNQYDLADTELITDQAQIAAKIQESMGLTIRLYEDKQLSLFALYGLTGQIENVLSRRVWLKSGGYLIIEPTEALTVIDVNTGKAPGNKKERETFYLQTNKEAAIEAARQLRLRNISGMILIDFINMENKTNQESLLAVLKDHLRKDPVQTVFVDLTGLGLVEITRKKTSASLAEKIGRGRKGTL